MKNHGETIILLTPTQDAFSKCTWIKVIESRLCSVVLGVLQDKLLSFGTPKLLVTDYAINVKYFTHRLSDAESYYPTLALILTLTLSQTLTLILTPTLTTANLALTQTLVTLSFKNDNLLSL